MCLLSATFYQAKIIDLYALAIQTLFDSGAEDVETLATSVYDLLRDKPVGSGFPPRSRCR